MTKARIEKLLSQIIGDYIRQHISLVGSEVFVSITQTKITPQLDIASIYLSMIGLQGISKEEFLSKTMSQHHWPIRRYVARRLRHVLRRIPAEIRFYPSDT